MQTLQYYFVTCRIICLCDRFIPFTLFLQANHPYQVQVYPIYKLISWVNFAVLSLEEKKEVTHYGPSTCSSLTASQLLTLRLLQCYNQFNLPLDASQLDKPLCSLQMTGHMFAAVDTPTCKRRNDYVNSVNQSKPIIAFPKMS